MSKMSQLHAELSEQANELGFETIQDAVNSGYVVDYDKGKLVKYGLGYSETVEYLAKEQEKAHEAWLKEKENLLYLLKEFAVQFEGTLVHRHKEFFDLYRRLEKFIKEAHD